MRIEPFLDELGTQAVKAATGEESPALLRPTQDPKHGDYQMNAAMALGKRLGRPPREVAESVAAEMLKHEAISAAEVAGPGFVNLRLDAGWIASRVNDAISDADRDGVPTTDNPEKIVVDFSAPNIAKQMHVGHLRSTIIGDSIVRMLRFVGHEVIGDNHLGDWGTQFGLLIVGMNEWGDQEALDADAITELERVYKLASARAGEDSEFADRARGELSKLQSGDVTNRALWERFVSATRVTLEEVYKVLDVHFDEWLGESAYHDQLPGVVDELLEKKLAREDDGAICVFWKELPDVPKALKKQNEPFIVRKKDGAFLYSTTDIATVQHRKNHFKADRAVYVVDTRQGLHFKQLFALCEMLGIDMELTHVGFGMMLGDDGKPLRTRDASGKTVPLLSLLGEAVERAEAKMREEGLKVPEESIKNVATTVGIGAVKYSDLHQNRTSDYTFDWDKMITFKGNAGPYMQYAYARTQNVLRKADRTEQTAHGNVTLQHEAEADLGRRLLAFADAVHAAAESYQPHLICDHLYTLARAYSSFYTQCPILKAQDEATKESRLALNAMTGRQVRRGLSLLGIGTVDRM